MGGRKVYGGGVGGVAKDKYHVWVVKTLTATAAASVSLSTTSTYCQVNT